MTSMFSIERLENNEVCRLKELSRKYTTGIYWQKIFLREQIVSDNLSDNTRMRPLSIMIDNGLLYLPDKETSFPQGVLCQVSLSEDLFTRIYCFIF